MHYLDAHQPRILQSRMSWDAKDHPYNNAVDLCVKTEDSSWKGSTF